MSDSEIKKILEERLKEGYTYVFAATAENLLGCSTNNSTSENSSLLYIFNHPDTTAKTKITEHIREGYGFGKYIPFIDGEFDNEEFGKFLQEKKIYTAERLPLEIKLREYREY